MDSDPQPSQASESKFRVIEWFQEHDNITVTDPTPSSDKVGSEKGLISDLHDGCLQVLFHLRAALKDLNNKMNKPSNEVTRLGHCQGKLNLWGDILEGGRLEASLRIVPTLRQTILENLVKIAQALLNASRMQSSLGMTITTTTKSREDASALTTLVERALDVLGPQESELSDSSQQGRTTYYEYSSSGFASNDPKFKQSQPDGGTWVLTLLRVLTFRTRLLMQILPTIQQILTTAERVEHPKPNQRSVNFHVSESARQWVRQIFDKFENANERLAERLGQANAERYDEIRKLKSQSDPTSTDQAEGPAKSMFRPPTVFHDSGVGTSIMTPAEIPASVASHLSFMSSLAEGSSRRVPKTPAAVVLGLSTFECEICGNMVFGIKNRTQWKAHVFADIKPYLCTFNECEDQFTVFPARKLWEDHEYRRHRSRTSFACYLCHKQLVTEVLLSDHLRLDHGLADLSPQQLAAIVSTAKKLEPRPTLGEQCPLCQKSQWKTPQALAKHLGKHLEDIALLALPPEDDSEDEKQQSDDEHNKHSGSEGSSAESPNTKNPSTTVPVSTDGEMPEDQKQANRPRHKPFESGGPSAAVADPGKSAAAAGSTTNSPGRPSHASNNSNSKRRGRSGQSALQAFEESDDSDDDIQPIYFFVPGENIHAAVLVEYINRYVDSTAKIKSAQHPTDKNRTGFNVSAKRALNAVSIRDLINDSRDWEMERQSREYRRDPYDYRESDTARRRAKKGPTEGGTYRPQRRPPRSPKP